VVIESNDILLYLEEEFPDPPLRPSGEAERRQMEECIAGSSNFQPAFKTLSHELLFRPFRKVSAEELELFEKGHPDPELVEFLREYAAGGPTWDALVADARGELEKTLDGLELALEESAWLSGDDYGLADISWVVNANRFDQAKIDVEGWPRFRDWGRRAMQRPAFDRAVVSWRP
jgi:glutathione S-transferase